MAQPNGQKIILVGHYPPPVGGVSVHLQRWFHFLRSRGKQVLFIDTVNRSTATEGVRCLGFVKSLLFFLGIKGQLVHFHKFSAATALQICMASLRNKTMITLHNERFYELIKGLNFPLRHILVAVLRRLDTVVVVNEKAKKDASLVFRKSTPVHLIPAFVLPAEIQSALHLTILEFREKFKVLMSLYVSRLKFHLGQDLYGFDMAIELMRHLPDASETGLVVVAPVNDDPFYLQELKKRVAAYGQSERILIIEEVINTLELYRLSDVYLRPTNTDGNSLSVLEALYMGTPVVASDCSERPEGTVLFKTRNQDAFNQAVSRVLDDLKAHKTTVSALEIKDFSLPLLNVYQNLL